MGKCYSKPSKKKDDGYSLNQNSDKADNINMETTQISIAGEKEITPVPDQRTEISALKTEEIKVIRVHTALQASGNPVDADFISNQSSDRAENNVTEVTQITPAGDKEITLTTDSQTATSDLRMEENEDLPALDSLLMKENRAVTDCLTRHLVVLSEGMAAKEVSIRLESKRIITHAEAVEIRAATSYDANQKLVDLMMKRGLDAFLSFITALEETGQQRLAEILRASHVKTNERPSSFQTTQQSLKTKYLKIFKTVYPFSLPFTFDIENTWVSLALKGLWKNSLETGDHGKLIERAFKKDSNDPDTEVKILIIEGDPATGKTSLMRKLAYGWAKGEQELFCYDLVLYAEFRDVREQKFKSIADLVLECSKKYFLDRNNSLDSQSCENLKKLMNDEQFCEEHRVLVLLDGYDESSLSEQCTELNTYLAAKTIGDTPLFNVVITTRRAHLSHLHGRKGRFVFAEVLGFTTNEQKQKYISNHFASIENSTVHTTKVLQLLNINDNLNKLAETPLFLTFICLVHERIVNGTLLELYCSIIWWLIDRHQQDFPDRDIPALFGLQNGSSDKFETIQNNFLHFPQLQCLSSMALHNLEKDVLEYSEYEKFNLQPIIEEVGLLIKGRKHDDSFKVVTSFFFPHRTIQEFLAALYCFCANDPTSKWLSPNSKLHTLEMSEFEKFILRIALSKKLPIHTKKLKYDFERITDIYLHTTFEAFNTSTGFNNELLNWFLSQCKNVQSITLRGTPNSARHARNVLNSVSIHKKLDSKSKMLHTKVFSFSELMKLSSLAFEYYTFDANSLLSIINCPSLKNLKFSYCSIENGTHLDFGTLPELDNVNFFKCTFETNSQLSFTDCLSVKNLIFIVCNMKSSTKFVVGTSSVIDSAEFILCETHLATWQSFTDAIRNSSGRCLKLSADYIVERIYPGFLHHLLKCERVEEIHITDTLFLNRNEEEVIANLAEIARILPKLECIIIILDAYSRKLKEENKERIEKAGQERNPDFSIKYMEENLPGAEEANRVNVC